MSQSRPPSQDPYFDPNRQRQHDDRFVPDPTKSDRENDDAYGDFVDKHGLPEE